MRISLKVAMRVLAVAVSSILILSAIVIFLDKTRTILFFSNSKEQVILETRELFEVLHIGMNNQESLNLIQDFTKNKKFIVNDNNSVIQIISPYDYSFTWSWTIYIFLDKNNIIQGKAVRAIDDVKYSLCNAPQDVGVIPEQYKVSYEKCIQ